METHKEIAANMRHFAADNGWNNCLTEFMRVFDEVDRQLAFNLVLEQLRDYQQIFVQSHSDYEWIPQILKLLEASGNNRELETLLRWEEFDRWDETAFFSSVEYISWAYQSLNDAKYTDAKDKIKHAMQAIMNAHRYHFWVSQYPHLEPFWGLDDDLDGRLAHLSFVRDPLVNAFVKNRWYRVSENIEGNSIL